jgi:hypothetical protein
MSKPKRLGTRGPAIRVKSEDASADHVSAGIG